MRKIPLLIIALAGAAIVTSAAVAQPVNDDCANASVVTLGLTDFDTTDATTDGPDEPGCQFPGGNNLINQDIWYAFTPDASGPYVVSTCSMASFDTRLAVYADACPLGPDEAIACNDDEIGCLGFTSRLVFQATAQTTYLIRVGGYNEGAGPGTLEIAEPPPAPDNDDCENAVAVGLNSLTPGTTTGATNDEAPDCGTEVTAPGVWYALVGDGSEVTVETCDEVFNYDTRLNVYRDGCQTLTCVGGSDDACGQDLLQSQVTFESEEGVSYLVLVQGFLGATGDFNLRVRSLGDAEDCNANGVPDECDVSCENEGCDAWPACGTYPDCNGDNVPDECQGEPFGPYESEPNLAIPDNTPEGVMDTIKVEDSGVIADVDVNVVIAHAFIGDLTIDVEHGGVSVRLWDRQCGGSINMDVIFDDEGDPVACSSPTVGRFQPVGALSDFDLGNIQGDWTLTVADNGIGDIGTLVKWGIAGTLRGVECCTGHVLESSPPDGAIDARELHEFGNPDNLTGLRSFVVVFDDSSTIVAQCFGVEETGGGTPPNIVNIEKQGNEVRVNFDRPITEQQWTTLAYNGTGGRTLIDVGFLPGDVNQSKASNGTDISELVDCLNESIVCADYQTDINRSGDPNGNDITRLINVLQAVPNLDPRAWLNETIVDEPNP